MGVRSAGRRGRLQHRSRRRRCSPGSATSRASPSTATARRACRRSAWLPTPSRPARATASSPPASRPSAATAAARQRHRPNPIFETAGRAHRRAFAGWSAGLDAARGSAGPVHRDGSDRRERRAGRGRHPARRWTSSLRAASSVRSPTSRTASGRTRSPRSRCPTARSCRRTTVRVPAPPSRASPAQAGVPSRRVGHRRQRLPAQRRRRRGDGDERHQGQGARPHTARADRLVRCVGAEPGDHGSRSDRGLPSGAGAGRHDDRRHRPGRDQRGVRGAGDPVGHVTSASRGTSSTSTADRSRSVTRSG